MNKQLPLSIAKRTWYGTSNSRRSLIQSTKSWGLCLLLNQNIFKFRKSLLLWLYTNKDRYYLFPVNMDSYASSASNFAWFLSTTWISSFFTCINCWTVSKDIFKYRLCRPDRWFFCDNWSTSAHSLLRICNINTQHWLYCYKLLHLDLIRKRSATCNCIWKAFLSLHDSYWEKIAINVCASNITRKRNMSTEGNRIEVIFSLQDQDLPSLQFQCLLFGLHNVFSNKHQHPFPFCPGIILL